MIKEKIISKMLHKHITTEKGCWEFPNWNWKNPYGGIWFEKKRWRLHKLSMFLFKPTEYNEYLNTLHKCNNRKCFNPEHLYCGTQSDNMYDQVAAGTHNHANKTHCVYGHELIPENTYIVPKTRSRQCKICRERRHKAQWRIK
jgi:hypothetical protein